MAGMPAGIRNAHATPETPTESVLDPCDESEMTFKLEFKLDFDSNPSTVTHKTPAGAPVLQPPVIVAAGWTKEARRYNPCLS